VPQFLRRPLPLALLIAGLAELLFAWRVTIPSKPYFDEVHYVPAARTLLALARPANIEHPLLAKELIALGIWLFGDDPLGWRILSTLAGSAVVAGVFALVWLGTRRLRPALVASVLTLVNFTVFVQARIAMLDGFMAAFVILGAASLLWSMHGAPGQVRRRWCLARCCWGWRRPANGPPPPMSPSPPSPICCCGAGVRTAGRDWVRSWRWRCSAG